MLMTKISNGPLLMPGSSVNGALLKKSESSNVSDVSTSEKLSPFRNTTAPVLFVIVPTTSTELPGVPDTGDKETLTLSACSAGHSNNSAVTAITAKHPRFFMLVTPNWFPKILYGKTTRKLAPQLPLVAPPAGSDAV